MVRNDQESIKTSNINSRITAGTAHHHMSPLPPVCGKTEKAAFSQISSKRLLPCPKYLEEFKRLSGPHWPAYIHLRAATTLGTI